MQRLTTIWAKQWQGVTVFKYQRERNPFVIWNDVFHSFATDVGIDSFDHALVAIADLNHWTTVFAAPQQSIK